MYAYKSLDHYNGPKCNKSNYLSFGGQTAGKWNGGAEEPFVSLSASVRRPFSPGYYDPDYVQPKWPGVN